MKNFFKHIKYKYDNNTHIRIKQYCNDNNKLAKQSERLQFLLQCKKFGAIPAHLKHNTKITNMFKQSKIKKEAEKIEKLFHERILKLEIKATITTIQELKKNMKHNKEAIEAKLENNEAKNFFETQANVHTKIRQKTKTTHLNKLNRLIKILIEEYNFIYNEDWFHNTTNIEFPEQSKWLLSLGAKFAIPINKNTNKLKYINTREKYQLNSSAAQTPKLYGLPKIHKEGIPLRPISASQKVPCYNLAKYTGKILQNMVSEEYNIKDAYQLKEKLTNIILDDDEVLISYDVIALFTNIPVHTAINIIMKKWHTIQHLTNIPKSQFLKILQFCLKDNNYFQFDNKMYHQTFGVPMGNPLSPTIANIVLDDLLEETINHLKAENIQIKTIFKYVDDFFAIIKKDDNNKILDHLNKYHNKLKFTSELEKNGQLPFLDVKLHRKNNKIIFDWYRKELASGRIINFHSTQPKKMVINTATNFIKKVLTISDAEFKNKNIEIIKETLTKNSFPITIINTLIKNYNCPKNNARNLQDGNTGKKYFSVNYVPALTDTKSMRAIIPNTNTQFAHKSHTTLRTLFSNTKGKTARMEQSNVVYQIACKGSEESGGKCEMFYIGQTKRTLRTRLAEHEADIKKGKQTTGLAQHMHENKHTADFTNTKILDVERRENKRLTLESLRIQQKGELSMNFKEDKNSTNSVYALVL